jgi:hypothetical protein
MLVFAIKPPWLFAMTSSRPFVWPLAGFFFSFFTYFLARLHWRPGSMLSATYSQGNWIGLLINFVSPNPTSSQVKAGLPIHFNISFYTFPMLAEEPHKDQGLFIAVNFL